MASSSFSSNGSTGSDQPSSGNGTPMSGSFECNICLDTAKDAVVSFCGHLYCWPCLHQWLEMRPNGATCPVCKAAISRDKVIPLYGRGSADQKDPREKVPPRPQGQRTEPENQGLPGFHNFRFGGGGGAGTFHGSGFQMSFGIGGFPFGVFSSFNVNPNDPRPANHGMAASGTDSFTSQIFLYIAIFFLLWLLIT